MTGKEKKDAGRAEGPGDVQERAEEWRGTPQGGAALAAGPRERREGPQEGELPRRSPPQTLSIR